MSEVRLHHFLPAVLGSLQQQRAEGELVLEQNDGTRRLFWAGGELVYLRSDAVGEQFGNFLVRRGVLDMSALNSLLRDGEGARMGVRVVEWGLMTAEERDGRLQELLGSILLHALEHKILKMTWNPKALEESLGGELPFSLDHRRLVWDTFQSAKIDQELVEMFRSEPDWRWGAKPDLLNAMSDLPLTPSLAYALSLLGTEPLGFETIGALSGRPLDEVARLVATLWALGGLRLVRGELPLLQREKPVPPRIPKPEPEPEPEPEPILLVQDDLVPEPAPPPPVFQSMIPKEREALDLTFLEPTPAVLPSFSPGEEEEALPAQERAYGLFVKAKSYMMQTRTSEAIRALEQSIKLDGDSPEAYDAWLMLGRLRIGNPAWSTRAVEALQAASRLNPRAAEPWALMGELYHRKGFQANAQGCFRRALELDPSVAVPSGWSLEDPAAPPQPEAPNGIMGKLRGMFSREKD